MTKEELGGVFYLTRQIKAEMARLEYLKECSERITKELDGLPRGDTGYIKSSVEILATQIVDTENKLSALQLQRVEYRSKVMREISSKVSDDTQRRILIERYCFENFFRNIATRVHLSESRVFALHRQALRALGITGRVNVGSKSTVAE